MAQLRPFFFKIRSTNDSKAPQEAGPEDCRRALAFIAGNADGYTRAVMLSHGFSLALTASLIHAGLATDRMPKRVGRGTVARVRITDAGRQALGEHEPSPSPSLLFVQARGKLIDLLARALAAAEELGDGATAYLIERALDEARAPQFRSSRE